jgi:pyruvate/2-oxoglutarate dehydrogenase complex dihydrolipoamide acyltransferase (E2) component
MSDLIEIKVDDPGDTVEVEILEYFVSEGDSVAAGTPLLEIATDKANMELEAPQSGVVEKLHFAQGDIVPAESVFVHLRAA